MVNLVLSLAPQKEKKKANISPIIICYFNKNIHGSSIIWLYMTFFWIMMKRRLLKRDTFSNYIGEDTIQSSARGLSQC